MKRTSKKVTIGLAVSSLSLIVIITYAALMYANRSTYTVVNDALPYGGCLALNCTEHGIELKNSKGQIETYLITEELMPDTYHTKVTYSDGTVADTNSIKKGVKIKILSKSDKDLKAIEVVR